MSIKVIGVRTAVFVLVAVTMFATRSAVAQQVLKVGRLPRVYNALITSEQRLLPSQAEPVVVPVFRPWQYVSYGWPYAVPHSSTAELSAAETADSPTQAVADDGGGDAQRPAVVKNNGPADSLVPDVPPPPLLPTSRVAGNKDKKKPEEYPPAPVGFAI